MSSNNPNIISVRKFLSLPPNPQPAFITPAPMSSYVQNTPIYSILLLLQSSTLATLNLLFNNYL